MRGFHTLQSARPFLQPDNGGCPEDPADAYERHFRYQGPYRRVDQAQGDGEDTDEDISHG